MTSDTKWQEIEQFANLSNAANAAGGGPESLYHDFMTSVPLNSLFELLSVSLSDGTSEVRIHFVRDSIKNLLSSNIGKVVLLDPNFEPTIIASLLSPSEIVRVLSVSLLKDTVLIDKPDALQSVELLKTVEILVADKNPEVSGPVLKLLIQFLGSKTLCSREVRVDSFKRLAQLRNNLDKEWFQDASSVEIRVLDLTCRLVSKGDEEIATDCLSSAVLDPLLDGMTGDDVLFQLNIVHLIPALGYTKIGFQKLVDSGILVKLIKSAGVSEEMEQDSFLGDEALRAVAPLCLRDNDTTATRFLDATKVRLCSSVMQEFTVGIEVVGTFAGSVPPKALEMLLSRDDILQSWFSHIANPSLPVRALLLHSIARSLRGGAVIRDDDPTQTFGDGKDFVSDVAGDQQTNDSERKVAAMLGIQVITKFGKVHGGDLSGDVIGLLSTMAATPFDELYNAVFALLRMIAAQDSKWGLEALFSSNKFVSLIFDRSLQLTKVGMEWRFSVLDAVARNPNHKMCLQPDVITNVKSFLRRGPYVGPENKAIPTLIEEKSA